MKREREIKNEWIERNRARECGGKGYKGGQHCTLYSCHLDAVRE